MRKVLSICLAVCFVFAFSRAMAFDDMAKSGTVNGWVLTTSAEPKVHTPVRRSAPRSAWPLGSKMVVVTDADQKVLICRESGRPEGS